MFEPWEDRVAPRLQKVALSAQYCIARACTQPWYSLNATTRVAVCSKEALEVQRLATARVVGKRSAFELSKAETNRSDLHTESKWRQLLQCCT